MPNHVDIYGSPASQRCTHRMSGFTLIELVIVVAIVAILAAIALPSYRQHVLKANRTQARADLMQNAQGLERWYSVNRRYDSSPLCGTTPQSPATGTARFTIAFACTASTFTITATPTGPQSGDLCGNSGLNHQGLKTFSGTGAAATAQCPW